jgi:FAD/FMN-containing dehydrogenase
LETPVLLEREMVTQRYDPLDLQGLRSRLLGDVLTPSDDGYQEARQVWNTAQQKAPALIVRCRDAADVIQAVNFARAHNLSVAVRSGGHSVAAYGSVEDGLMIDLSAMKAVSIDPQRRIARAEPGCTWGEYAEQAQAHGLATSSGDTSSVGIGGLALGGGTGWLVRKYGLTIDHVISVDVVTADGQLLTANADEHPDLFWALRGGGGNFGIATAFELRLQPVGMVLGGAVFYPASQAREVLRAYAEYATAAPDELTTMAMLLPAPPAPFLPAAVHGTPVVVIMVCYAGDLDEGQRVVAPLRALGTPIADIVGPMPYPGLFQMTREGTLKGLQHEVRSAYLDTLDDETLDAIVEHGGTAPLGMTQLRVLGGAMARVSAEETAFAHRTKPYLFTLMSSWHDPNAADSCRAWVGRLWDAVRPHTAGAYVNFLMDEGEERIREAYPPATYARLVAVKDRYDPTNVFHRNQNIRPTAHTTMSENGRDVRPTGTIQVVP